MSNIVNVRLFSKFLTVACLTFFIPANIQAQNTPHEFRINIYRSKVTEGGAASNGFFNTTTLGFEYQYELIENLNGIFGIRYIQIIASGDGDIDNGPEALDRFSKSFLTFDAGLSLIPFVIGNTFEIRFSPGLSLRHRNEVFPTASFEFKELPVLVYDKYQNSWDLGGFFNLEFVYFFHNNWLIGLRGQFHTFKEGDSVFDAGLSLGRKF